MNYSVPYVDAYMHLYSLSLSLIVIPRLSGYSLHVGRDFDSSFAVRSRFDGVPATTPAYRRNTCTFGDSLLVC